MERGIFRLTTKSDYAQFGFFTQALNRSFRGDPIDKILSEAPDWVSKSTRQRLVDVCKRREGREVRDGTW